MNACLYFLNLLDLELHAEIFFDVRHNDDMSDDCRPHFFEVPLNIYYLHNER
jgi:hypothetical protein